MNIIYGELHNEGRMTSINTHYFKNGEVPFLFHQLAECVENNNQSQDRNQSYDFFQF